MGKLVFSSKLTLHLGKFHGAEDQQFFEIYEYAILDSLNEFFLWVGAMNLEEFTHKNILWTRTKDVVMACWKKG